MHAQCLALFDTSSSDLLHRELLLVLACSQAGFLTGDVSDGGLKGDTIPTQVRSI